MAIYMRAMSLFDRDVTTVATSDQVWLWPYPVTAATTGSGALPPWPPGHRQVYRPPSIGGVTYLGSTFTGVYSILILTPQISQVTWVCMCETDIFRGLVHISMKLLLLFLNIIYICIWQWVIPSLAKVAKNTIAKMLQIVKLAFKTCCVLLKNVHTLSILYM